MSKRCFYDTFAIYLNINASEKSPLRNLLAIFEGSLEFRCFHYQFLIMIFRLYAIPGVTEAHQFKLMICSNQQIYSWKLLSSAGKCRGNLVNIAVRGYNQRATCSVFWGDQSYQTALLKCKR